MQRQENVPFLLHPSIFMALVRHLTPASIKNLEQTSQLGRRRVETVLNDPVQVLSLLGNYSREEAAQFFHFYRHYIGLNVCGRLQENPNHHAAFTLYAMICCLNPEMIDSARMTEENCKEAMIYLEENRFPTRVIDSLSFVFSFLWRTPADKLHELLPDGEEFYINLRGADLNNMVLAGCDLRGANLSGACLMEADMRGVNLNFADLEKSEVTYANFESAQMIGANLREMKEEFGFPLEPNVKDVRFFSSKRLPVVKETLDRFQQTRELPWFMLEAITNDFVKAEDQSSRAEELERLEYGMTHPLFATHNDWLPAFCNRHLFSMFTPSQRDITMEIEAIKTVLELENDGEPEQKRLK